MRKLFALGEENETATQRLGRRGEEIACAFLERKGFRLVAANFIVPIGRNRLGAIVNAEIDLIAYDRETLCFIEVKTRSSSEFAAPETAVNLRKQRQITRAAKAYRKLFRINETKARFDVVSVVLRDEQARPEIEFFPNFWSEAKFRKRHWSGALFSD